MKRGSGRSLRPASTHAALLLACCLAFGAPASAQPTWTSQGPGPAFGDGNLLQSFDAPPNGSSSGAVTAILPGQTANTILIGSVNGGIWKTTNGGATWVPTSDFAPSLSIAALAYDSSNSSAVYAGVGLVSNGSIGTNVVANTGGSRSGLLRSLDGGNTWSVLGDAQLGAVKGKSVVAVAGNGINLLAATAELNDSTAVTGYGLYVSKSGAPFAPASGVPTNAPATSLVGAGTTANPYYVAISGAGLYSSVNGGDSWTAVSAITFGANQAGRLATAANGAIAVAVYDPRSSGRMISVSLSQNGTQWNTWTVAAGQIPQVNNGGQALTNASIGLDPRNTSIVYIAGDSGGNSHDSPRGDDVTISAYRLVQQADGSVAVTPLTGSFTSNNSTIHADSRAFAFDVNGRLLLSSDGGIYARSNPQTTDGAWTGLNGNLAIREIYGVAYDGLSKRLLVAAQDNGIAFQTSPRGLTYTPVGGGDGLVAAINDSGATRSIVYFASQSLGFLTRLEVNSAGQVTANQILQRAANATNNPLNFLAADFNNGDARELPFASRLVLNRNDPTMIAIGTNFAYVTTDARLTDNTDLNPLTNAGNGNVNTLGGVTAMAYGTQNNANALVVGGANGLFYTAAAGTTVLGQLNKYTGTTPVSVVFDANSDQRFFAADGAALWQATSATGGGSFTNITGDFTSGGVARKGISALGITRPNSIEFISSNGVNAVLAGGLCTACTATSGSPVAYANVDPSSGNITGNFASFGVGLPNTVANQLVYNSRADLLAVSLFGRGVWTVYDVTSNFASATQLQFGFADNDSSPDAALLTNGNFASRNLVKRGTGTLTISGTTSYSGTTTVEAGTLIANGDLRGPVGGGGLTIDPGALVRGNGFLPGTTVNGAIRPGTAGVGMLTVIDGISFGAGSSYLVDVAPTAASTISVMARTFAGNATLGGTVSAIVPPGTQPQRTSTILTAPGGLAGSFAGASTNFPFLLASLGYSDSAVTLTLTPGGFAQAATGANQRAVGTVFDQSAATAGGDYATVLNAFSQLTPAQLGPALEAVSGQGYTGLGTLGVQTAQFFMGNFTLQAGGAAGGAAGAPAAGGGRIALAEACEVACDTVEGPRWTAWGGAFGGLGTVAGDPVAPGQTFNVGGFSAGLDRRIADGWRLGVTAGYAGSTSTTQGIDGRATADTLQAGLYSSFTGGPFYLDALVGYAHSDTQMTRPIAVPGLAPRTAIGHAPTDQLFGLIEGGRQFDLGGPWSSYVTPFARLQGSTATQAGFTESGAGSLNLAVASQTTNSLRTVLGAQLGAAFDMGWRERLSMALKAGWSHELADPARPMTASFAGAPAVPFTLQGAAAPRDGVALGLALNTAISAATSAYFRYDGELIGGTTSHLFSGGVTIRW
jgi:autotransporter-associated beta strand protein